VSSAASAVKLRRTAGFRHGIVLPPQRVKRTLADPAGVVDVGIPANSPDPWASAAGGIGRNADQAELAAIGEALERYAAATVRLPERRLDALDGCEVLELEDFSLFGEEQRGRPDFPYRDFYESDAPYTNVHALADNREVWVPSALVGLSAASPVTTSNGLAAGPSAHSALLRAVQELVERDALTVIWLHGVPGRRVELPGSLLAEVGALGGDVVCIDATPEYSPHPVALVCGQLPLRGRPRYSLGAACRETWDAAVEKAYLEWLQGVTFAGYYLAHNARSRFDDPTDVRTFDDHAVYYTLHPEQWTQLPLLRGETVVRRDAGPERAPAAVAESLAALAAALTVHGFAVYYRDLTTPDVREAGLAVVRALSPDLAPIGCDHRRPFLGGTVADVRRRYPWAGGGDLCFPNPHPHPLG
jgi:ribosomal protein S12 methylthiotransferase accessory factor